jgi:hypothetical protein
MITAESPAIKVRHDNCRLRARRLLSLSRRAANVVAPPAAPRCGSHSFRPWPCEATPKLPVTAPVESRRIVAVSAPVLIGIPDAAEIRDPMPVRSASVAMPMPTSRPSALASPVPRAAADSRLPGTIDNAARRNSRTTTSRPPRRRYPIGRVRSRAFNTPKIAASHRFLHMRRHPRAERLQDAELNQVGTKCHRGLSI